MNEILAQPWITPAIVIAVGFCIHREISGLRERNVQARRVV